LTARPQPKDGERRGLPDGGSQVFGGGRWHDARSAAGRRYASPPANDDARGPINIAAEQALLGALLLKPDAFFEVSGLVRPEHLHEPFHQRLFEVIKDRAENRGAAPELLATLFADDPAFADLGGVRYLADLIDRAPPPANAPDYARELATLYARRRLMEIGAEITALGAHSAAGDPDELIGDAERLLADASVEAGGRGGFVSARAMVKDAITYARTRPGKVEFTFGVDALDAHLGGMNPGETTLLAARPGVGKTVGALTVARGNAQAGLGTCVFSLEMSRNALGLRLASDLAFDRHAPCYLGESQNPTADKALKNLLSPEQWAKLEEAERIVAGWPLLIDDRSGLTLAQIEAEARRAHRERGSNPAL
jgi:replicative DNA helicase